MNILLIFVAVTIFMFFIFHQNKSENFSVSGLSISDDECHKLSSIYYKPCMNDPDCRLNGTKRICGRCRRNLIDYRTGNYYTNNGELI